MISPLSIGSIYWWPVPVVLSLVYFSWARHISNRLISKTRKRRDATLERKSKICIAIGVSLAAFLVGHLVIVDWKKPAEALMVWAGGYFFFSVFSIRCVIGIRESLREYHALPKA
jgi:hypothetical protein